MGITNLRAVDRNQEKLIQEWGREKPIEVQKKLVFLVLGAAVVSGGSVLMVGGLLQMNPVDTGRSRGNWQVSFGSPKTEEIEEIRSIGAVQSEAASVLAGVKSLGIVWIVNNLPYIVSLNNGHSKQAPAGWIDLAVQNAFSSFRRSK